MQKFFYTTFIIRGILVHSIKNYVKQEQETMEKQGYKIISDGAADLEMAYAKEHDIDIVPFYVSFDDKTYQKEIVEIGIREFYQKMVDEPKVFPKSSMPSVQDYMDVFEPYAKAGIPVICICITSKFSGSYNCARTAAGQLLETYPDSKITAIDSTFVTVAEGMAVKEAVRMRDDGVSYEKCVDNLMKMRESGRILFTIGGMSYLVHGGRVGKLMGVAANTLSIRPLITMKDGEIFPSGLARSRKKSKDKVIDMIIDYFKSCGESPDHYSIHVGYGYDIEEGASFQGEVKNALTKQFQAKEDGQEHIYDNIEVYQIGATIAVHTGPYPVGVGIFKKYEYA